MRAPGISFALTVLLAACGGGHGTNDAERTTLGTSVAEVVLQKTVGDVLDPLLIYVSVDNWSTETLYHRVEAVGPLLTNVAYRQPSSARGEIVVTFPVLGNLVPGTFSGHVDVSVCRDPSCQQHIAGSPLRVPVALTVVGIAPTTAVSEPGSGRNAAAFLGAERSRDHAGAVAEPFAGGR